MTLREEVIQHGFAADYIKYLILFMEQRGVPKAEILEAAGIEETDLERGEEWIYHTVNYNRVSEKIQEMGDGSLLGLEFGASISLKDHGYIGYAAGNTASLGEAIHMMAKYFRTRTTMFSLSIIEDGDFFIIQLDNHTELGDNLNFWVQAILGSLMTISTELFIDDLFEQFSDQIEVRLPFEKPKSLSKEVVDMLEGVSFGHSSSQIRIPSSLMNLPIKDPDKFVSEMAQKHCDDQLLNVEPMQQGIVARVRRCLEAEKGVYPNLEQVSNQLNMSSRSLKRKLRGVDTSFQVILDNLRKAEAVEYLCHSQHSIDEISRLLDFSDPSNFGRAFKKWTGVSPRAYRNRALEIKTSD